MNLAHVNSYYKTAANANITAERVNSLELRSIWRSTQKVDRDFKESELWSKYRRIVRRTLWDLLHVPLPFNHRSLDLTNIGSDLEREAVTVRRRSDPVFVEKAQEIATMFQDLSASVNDPLGERCRSILNASTSVNSLLILRNNNYRNVVVERFGSERCPVRIAVRSELRELSTVDTLVIVGQAKFFPEHVLNSPRAENIYIIFYNWLKDIDQVESFLPSSTGQIIKPIRSSVATVKELDEEDFLVPMVDWSALRLVTQGIYDSVNDSFDTENVQVRLYLLAGNHGVYLEAESGSSVLALNLEEDGERRVLRIDTVRIKPGDVILLRRERGGGDFIEELADRLLGSDASSLRDAQRSWKQKLRKKVTIRGIAGVERDLQNRGISALNIRYWMSFSSIQTKSFDDFQILMKYIGIEEQINDLWYKMSCISKAHQSAGQRIRRMLVDRVHRADLSQIRRDGFMDFQLSDEDAGVLTAFCVQAKAPEPEEVSGNRLRELFEIERDLWID